MQRKIFDYVNLNSKFSSESNNSVVKVLFSNRGLLLVFFFFETIFFFLNPFYFIFLFYFFAFSLFNVKIFQVLLSYYSLSLSKNLILSK